MIYITTNYNKLNLKFSYIYVIINLYLTTSINYLNTDDEIRLMSDIDVDNVFTFGVVPEYDAEFVNFTTDTMLHDFVMMLVHDNYLDTNTASTLQDIYSEYESCLKIITNVYEIDMVYGEEHLIIFLMQFIENSITLKTINNVG